MFYEWLRSCGFGDDVFFALAGLSVHSFPELTVFLGDNVRLSVLRGRLSDSLTLDLLIAVRTTVQCTMAAQPQALFSPLSTAFAPFAGSLQGLPPPPFQASFQTSFQAPLPLPLQTSLQGSSQASLQAPFQASLQAPSQAQAPLQKSLQTPVSPSPLVRAPSGSTDCSSSTPSPPPALRFPTGQPLSSLFPTGPLPSLTAVFPHQPPLPHDADSLVGAQKNPSFSHDSSDGANPPVEDSSSALTPHRGSPSASPNDQESHAIIVSHSSRPQYSRRALGTARRDPSFAWLPMPKKFVIPPTVRVYPQSPSPPRSAEAPSPDSQDLQGKGPNKRRRGFNWQLIYSLTLSDFENYKEAQALAMRLKDFPNCVNEHRHSFNNVFRCRESLDCPHLTKVHNDEVTRTIYIYHCETHVGHPLTRSPSVDPPRRGLDMAVKVFIEKHAQKGLKPRKIYDMMVRHNAECKEEHLMLHLPTMKQVQNYYDRTHYDRKRPSTEADGPTAEEEPPSPPQCDDEQQPTQENEV